MEGQDGVWDEELHTTMNKTDKQYRFIVQQRAIEPLFHNNFKLNILYKNRESKNKANDRIHKLVCIP